MKCTVKRAVGAVIIMFMVMSMLITTACAAGASTSDAPTEAINNVYNFTYAKVEESTTESAPSVDPVIIDFSTKGTMQKNADLRNWTGESDTLGGVQKFVTLPDGTQCMQILPHKYTGKASAGASSLFRMMPYLTESNLVTEDHKFMRITYMTSDVSSRTITLTNNASGKKAVLVSNTAVSQGEFVISAPVDISSAGLNTRYSTGLHCAFEYNTTVEDSEIYIKEIGFFASEGQAYEYYGDAADSSKISYLELSLGTNGNCTVKRGANWGNSTDLDNAVVISWAEKTEWANIHYRTDIYVGADTAFGNAGPYIRVLYSAKNPSDVQRAAMHIQNNASGKKFLVTDNVVNTDGEFVLSDVALVDEATFKRFTSVQNAIVFNALSDGGQYTIKSVYFFKSREAAQAFSLSMDRPKVSVNGNDISKYQIVVDNDTPDNVMTAANSVSSAIERLSGVAVPVVTDETAVSPYEILVGKSDRPLSTANMDRILALGETAYGIFVEGDTVIITSDLGLSTVTAVETANVSLFYDGSADAPMEINITSAINTVDNKATYKKIDYWADGKPVLDPTVVTVDFTTDEGYFNEDNGEKNWVLDGGAYKTNATDFASSYLNTYEKNVIFKAKLTYTAENDGSMGIMARVNSEHAYVKAGYDFEAGEWYIESRDGRDNFLERVASKTASVAPNTVYELILVTDGEYATLSVNGETVIANAKVNHVSPGRLGIYAERASVAVDDIEITLVSGQGTVWQNVAHTKLPYDSYLEGGTVHKRDDGSLTYLHPYGVTYKSIDNGYSWQETEVWSDNHKHSYSNMIRLNNGDFLRIGQATIEGKTYKVSQTSSDDGITWSEPSIICFATYKETTTAVGSNMNDKLYQSAATTKWANRIFYSQQYESTAAAGTGGLVEGRYVFCQFYYSDDNGKTWTKSETDSWTIPGNENEQYFSECKLLECADGTIRIYNSWNKYGCIVYSESTDGGKTFGPLQKMEEFRCPSSSMQFVRDPYAENDYTYYMVWCNSDVISEDTSQPRSRLSLAKTTDGKNWVYLGDVWRWESTWSSGNTPIHHIVDPFIYVTEDYIICGMGASDSKQLKGETKGLSYHNGQRQHIYSIRKDKPSEETVINKFADVPYGTEIYEAVDFVSSAGLFQGTSDTTFSPDMSMTRAMFVTVLGRLAEADTAKYTMPTFDDVEAGQWYTPYVEWAAANGIVNGLGDGSYGIDNAVTVQQACVILARYAEYKTAANGTGKTAADFADGTSVASWAAKEVDWAVANGIYTGNDGKLGPEAPASRALVAVMFNNYVKAFGR